MSSEFYVGDYRTSYIVTSRETKVKLIGMSEKGSLVFDPKQFGVQPRVFYSWLLSICRPQCRLRTFQFRC